jgi:AcrR family transcriptional regulator
MTVYRRFPGKEALVEAVLQREVQRFFADLVGSMPSEGTLAERVAAVFATGTHRVISEPLFSRLLETDPEAVLPFVTTRGGALVDFVISYVERVMAADPEAHGLPEERIAQAAETIVRLGHSIVLSTGPRSRPREQDLRALGLAVLGPLLT